jgi:peptidyl-prolyl cis-trans isomerase D
MRDIVTQQWALAEGNKLARAKAEEVRKALASGQSMASAIAGIEGAKVENINSTRGELKQQGQQVSPPLALMFSMKKGTAKTIQAPRDLGWFVVQLNEVVRGDASGDTERLENNQAELTNQLSQEYAAQLINAAKKEVGVEKNESAIKALRDSLTGKNQQ